LSNTTGQWRGGQDVVRAANGEITAPEVSEAAQVVHAVVPHLLNRAVPIEEALHELSVWIYQHNWTDAYENLKTKRPSTR